MSIQIDDRYTVLVLFICLTSPVPQPTVTITRSHSNSVLVGTELVLTADISFRDHSRVNVDKSLDILWKRGNNAIVNDTHITISAVSGSGDSYTASLTHSPILPSQIVARSLPLLLSGQW